MYPLTNRLYIHWLNWVSAHTWIFCLHVFATVFCFSIKTVNVNGVCCSTVAFRYIYIWHMTILLIAICVRPKIGSFTVTKLFLCVFVLCFAIDSFFFSSHFLSSSHTRTHTNTNCSNCNVFNVVWHLINLFYIYLKMFYFFQKEEKRKKKKT